MRKYAKNHSEFMKRSKFPDSYELVDFSCKMVSAAAKTGTPQEGMEVLKTVFDCGYVKKGAFSVIGEYIQGYIDKYVQLNT